MIGLCALLLVSAPTARLPVAVIGEGICPSPAEVEERLRELLPVRALEQPLRVASVVREGGGVRVTVREPAGAVVAERLLPAVEGCAEAAAAAALAIAAWETEAHSEFGAAPPPAEATRSAPPTPPPIAAYDLGAGVAASLAGSWRPGVLVRATFTPRGHGLGVGAFAAWEAERSSPLGPGRASWSRSSVGASGHLRWRGQRLAVEGRAEVALGFVSLQGAGFGTDLTALGVSPGIGGGARLLLPVGARAKVAAWVDASAFHWLRRETGFELPGGSERSLPRLAVLLTLGVGFGSF